MLYRSMTTTQSDFKQEAKVPNLTQEEEVKANTTQGEDKKITAKESLKKAMKKAEKEAKKEAKKGEKAAKKALKALKKKIP